MTTTLHTILEEFRQFATSNRDLGDKFERLFANYLITDLQFSDKYTKENVWLWREWQYRWGNKGIDLADSPVDWSTFSINRPQSITLKPQKILRPHQITALNKCAKMRLKPTVRYQIQ